MGDLLELGVSQDILKKAGAFYSYGETRLGQGRENSKEFLIQHPEIADSIEARIRGWDPGSKSPSAESAEPGTGDAVPLAPSTSELEEPE
jgi:recombination protein RecA